MTPWLCLDMYFQLRKTSCFLRSHCWYMVKWFILMGVVKLFHLLDDILNSWSSLILRMQSLSLTKLLKYSWTIPMSPVSTQSLWSETDIESLNFILYMGNIFIKQKIILEPSLILMYVTLIFCMQCTKDRKSWYILLDFYYHYFSQIFIIIWNLGQESFWQMYFPLFHCCSWVTVNLMANI